MEFLSLHSSKPLLRLPVWFATPLILWIPAGFLWEPHGAQGTLGVLFHESGKQLDISSCKLWFKEFHKMSRALLAWSPLHKLNHTTSQISYLNFAVRYMERTRSKTIRIRESHSLRLLCLHFFAYIFVVWLSFIWQSLGRMGFGYIYKMLSA